MIVTPVIMKLVKINFLVVLFFLIVSNSYAEFKPFTKKQFLDERMKMLSKRFDQIDTNKDGTIDQWELIRQFGLRQANGNPNRIIIYPALCI